MQQNAPFCILLKKIPFYHVFFHTTGIFKDMTEQILYPKYNRIHHFASWKKYSDPPLLVSRGLACVSMGHLENRWATIKKNPVIFEVPLYLIIDRTSDSCDSCGQFRKKERK